MESMIENENSVIEGENGSGGRKTMRERRVFGIEKSDERV